MMTKFCDTYMRRLATNYWFQIRFQWYYFVISIRIYASMNWVKIDSGNGIVPLSRQSIAWTNVDSVFAIRPIFQAQDLSV